MNVYIIQFEMIKGWRHRTFLDERPHLNEQFHPLRAFTFDTINFIRSWQKPDPNISQHAPLNEVLSQESVACSAQRRCVVRVHHLARVTLAARKSGRVQQVGMNMRVGEEAIIAHSIDPITVILLPHWVYIHRFSR